MSRTTRNAERFLFSVWGIIGVIAFGCFARAEEDRRVRSGESRYLVPGLYTADPSAHVFDGKLYIYPSHDIETDVEPDDYGAHFDMRDYHVFSMKSFDSDVTDHGVGLSIADIPWAGRQLWAPDCAEHNGKYYLYFPAKDKNDIFRIGVATSERPEGPFAAQPHPIAGSYSIDPSVFRDADGSYYMYFGGIMGGQLQRYRDNKAIECGALPTDEEPALCPKVVRLTEDMFAFAEEPRDAVILDPSGEALKAGDEHRRFFEAAWVHKFNGMYYLSYSTGGTHKICYATSDSPYGPFTYQGVILTPVVGWTTHHSICEFNGDWLLFHHDSVPSGGNTSLRSMKVVKLFHQNDGTIETIEGQPGR
ncbi:MAG: glycoside hydrolase family 43 protein [Rhodopirellula sp. JB044]|uniref:glycoside hydrolase family 43 protein n=1 Tax=Rhodopirellula sp. JB044 TaxID=3342844 RepID=UPI00370CB5E1